MRHPDHRLFKPTSVSQKIRQSIYAFLLKHPDQEFLFMELPKPEGISAREINSAVKGLARKGFVERIVRIIPSPSKKRPDKARRRLAVKLIKPWASEGSKPEQPWDERHPLFNGTQG
jgi:hypothetical protein